MTDPLADVLVQMTPEQLLDVYDTLDPADVELIERALAEIARAGWRSSPAAMAAHLDQTFRRWRYTELLSRKFVDAVEGRSIRQIWNVPARYGKSFIASQWGPTWALERDPTLRLILASYGDDLASENAIAVRDNLLTYPDLSCKLRPDRRRMDRFVTDQGGGLIGAGIGSRLTGFGGTGAIIDDPHKDWQEAHSEANRRKVWNWYRAVLRLRLDTDDAWIIVVQTRWHEDDLTGKLLEAAEDDGEQWELVRLPALADDVDDPIGRDLGEPLEPERFSLEAVLDRARTLQTYLASGLEQQRPSPEEGTDIMRAWWAWYDALPPAFDDELASWDMKLKEKDSGDFVVGEWWGRTGSDYWLGDMMRGRYNFPTVQAAVVLMKVRHPTIERHVIENTGNGPEVMEALRAPRPGYVLHDEVRSVLGITDSEVEQVEAWMRRGLSGIIPENPKGDKRARMRAVTPIIEGRHAHVPRLGSIGIALVDEMASFPNGAHDDMVDSASQALSRLSKPSGGVERITGTLQTPKPSARSAGAGVVRIANPRRSLPRRR